MGTAPRGDMPRNTTESMMSEALGCLHAPDDLAERALAASHARHPAHRGHARKLVSVFAMTLVAALAFGGTAYAVVRGGLFERAYGGAHGLDSTQAWSIQGDDGTTYDFQMSLESVAGKDVMQAIVDATEEVNLVASANGYTLTVESMVLDANGAGAATFTLTSDHGFKLYPDAVAGDLVFDTSSDLRLISMDVPSEASIDERLVYEVDSSTDSEIRGTIYFSSQGPDTFKDGVTWGLFIDSEGQDGKAKPHVDVNTAAFRPTKALAARTFGDASGATASLTPLSLRLDFPETNGGGIVSRLTLEHADGTSQLVTNDTLGEGGPTTTNYYSAYGWEADRTERTVMTLSQAADPGAVDSISVTKLRYSGNEGEKVTQFFALKPM